MKLMLPYLACLGIFSTFVSCSMAELTPAQIQNELKNPSGYLTRSSGIPVDSLSSLVRMQSDKDLMLLDQIWFKDGAFVLALSREDASLLGISEEMYDKYARYVEKANESIK